MSPVTGHLLLNFLFCTACNKLAAALFLDVQYSHQNIPYYQKERLQISHSFSVPKLDVCCKIVKKNIYMYCCNDLLHTVEICLYTACLEE